MNLDSQTLGTVVAGINDWVVSKAEWDDLETETTRSVLTAGVYKNNTIYFVEGDYVDPAIESLIRSYWVDSRGTDAEYKAQNLSDIEINWFYQPVRDFDVRVERHNIDRTVKNATVMNNQKDSTLELSRYGNALKSHINRISNDTFEVSIRYSDLVAFTTWDINDYTSDGYKIVKIKFMTRDNSLDVTYLFTKNQSILNPQTSVNRAVSPFTISKRNILTCYTFNEYVEFSGTDRTTTSSLTDNGLKTMFNALKWDGARDLPIYNAQFFSIAAGAEWLNMSVMAIPMGQSFVFNAEFQEPRIAGYQLTADGILGHKLVPIPYADDNGQLDSLTIRWGNGGVVVPDDHPVGAADSGYMFDIDTETVNLNPNEILGITHHQHVITDRSNLIVGDFFNENNSLIKELSSAPSATLVYFTTNPRDICD
jgi:hypothetical protein